MIVQGMMGLVAPTALRSYLLQPTHLPSNRAPVESHVLLVRFWDQSLHRHPQETLRRSTALVTAKPSDRPSFVAAGYRCRYDLAERKPVAMEERTVLFLLLLETGLDPDPTTRVERREPTHLAGEVGTLFLPKHSASPETILLPVCCSAFVAGVGGFETHWSLD